MKILRIAMALGLLSCTSGVFTSMPLALASSERTTAGEVVDPETNMVDRDKLKAFVLSARDYTLSLTEHTQHVALLDEFREEGGDWNSGNMYIVLVSREGIVILHGEDRDAFGINIRDLEDDDGVKVLQLLQTAAGSTEDGGFAEYTWDDPSDPNDTNPKVCYAVWDESPEAENPVLIVGGFYQEIPKPGAGDGEFPDPPAVTAGDVVDRETLKAFVQGIFAWVVESEQALAANAGRIIGEISREGGPWRRGSTYLFVMTTDGYVVFHAARPDQAGKIQVDRQDRNGFKFVKALIDAATAGGGYVEYYWDDPAVQGDEDVGSAKVGYAEAFEFSADSQFFPGQTLVIGSGFYKGNHLALDFAHFANGSSISSDVVLVNLAATPIRPAVYFYDKSGALIPPDSVAEIMGNLETTDYGALTLQSELPSLGEVTISTHGQGDLVTGSVKVVTEGPGSPIGGVLRFDAPGIDAAGVGAGQPVRDAIFPARRQEGGIDTGAAFRNLSESELTLTCRLMTGGEVMEEKPFTLPANGQDAGFISQIFEHDMSDFTGSVRCTAPPGEQEFTGVAVEMDAMNGIFTALPFVPLDREMSSEETASEQ